MKSKTVLIALILLAVAVYSYSAEHGTDKNRNEVSAESMRVHGRLSVYNGNPSCRIWIVGTKRILGIREFEEECPIPVELHRILAEDVNDRLIYADFIVRPLTEQKDGVMQIVQFESAENIVVTTRDRQFLRKIDGVIKF
jgi:hypothetical protein